MPRRTQYLEDLFVVNQEIPEEQFLKLAVEQERARIIAKGAPIELRNDQPNTSPIFSATNNVSTFQTYHYPGSPEGVLEGNPGDVSIDTSSGGSWQKLSGFGDTTGWNRRDYNQIIIRSQNDFPVQDASTITLNSGHYAIDGAVILTKRFVITENASVEIQSTNQASHFIIYVGGGTLFTGNPRFLFLKDIFVAGFLPGSTTLTSTLFDLDKDPDPAVRSTLFMKFVTLSTFLSFGNVRNQTTVLGNGVDLSNFQGGFNFHNNEDFVLTAGRFNTSIFGGSGSGAAIRFASGTFESMLLSGTSFSPQANESYVYFDPSITFTKAVVTGNTYANNLGGTFFESGSIDETDPRLTITSNGIQADSAVVGAFFFTGNTDETVISKQGLDTSITSFVDAGSGQITVNAAGHDVTNGEEVIIDGLTPYDGTYTASNVVASVSFEITAVFTTTGTGLVRTGFVDVAGTAQANSSIERFTFSTSPNEITSTSLENVKLTGNLHVSALRGSSSLVTYEFAVLCNGIIVPGAIVEESLTNKVKSTSLTFPDTVSLGNVYKIMARNIDGSTNLTVSSLHVLMA
jgi:hypothetical protein